MHEYLFDALNNPLMHSLLLRTGLSMPSCGVVSDTKQRCNLFSPSERASHAEQRSVLWRIQPAVLL